MSNCVVVLKGLGTMGSGLIALFTLGHIGAWVAMRVERNPNSTSTYYDIWDRLTIGLLIVFGIGITLVSAYIIGGLI